MNSLMAAGRTLVYVSDAGPGEIIVLSLDLDHGALAEVQRVALGGTVMPLALSPNRQRLYAARRSAPLAAISLAIGADGRLAMLTESALPASMAYIATDASGRFLFSASYGGDLIAVSTIDAQGRVQAVTQVQTIEPHAHAIRADATNRFVFATSLGGNLLRRFDFNADSGALTAHAEPRVQVDMLGVHPPGPRHLAFHPNGRWLYVINELDATIMVFNVDARNAATALRQRVGSLPPGFSGEPWAAEIRIAPDGRHLYTSERRSSTLAAFRIDTLSGELSPLGHQPTQAQPRSFAIDPSGRWLVAAGERSGAVRCHAIDAVDGCLSPGTASLQIGSSPNWVEIVGLP